MGYGFQYRQSAGPGDFHENADGFEGFDEGYLVARATSQAEVTPDVPLRVTISGKVWYGPLKVERSDATEDGLDVTSQLSGTFPSLRNDELSIYRHQDEGTLTYAPRVRVQLIVPESR